MSEVAFGHVCGGFLAQPSSALLCISAMADDGAPRTDRAARRPNQDFSAFPALFPQHVWACCAGHGSAAASAARAEPAYRAHSRHCCGSAVLRLCL